MTYQITFNETDQCHDVAVDGRVIASHRTRREAREHVYLAVQHDLIVELDAWQSEQGLPHECAEEQSARVELSDEQRDWLTGFCRRWMANEEG